MIWPKKSLKKRVIVMNNQYPVLVPDLMEKELVQLKSLLPNSVPYDRFVTCAKTAFINGSGIEKAEKKSVIAALCKCALDGLVPDGNEAVLLPFNCNVGTYGNDLWEVRANYIPMVSGILKRARMSGEVLNISSKALYPSDTFSYWMDEGGERLNYVPNLDSHTEAVNGAFAYAQLRNTSGNKPIMMIEYMSLVDINKVRAASKNSNKASSPWVKWFSRMACKSVLHRLCRRLPNASEVVKLCEEGMDMDFDKSEEAKQIVDFYPDEKFITNLPRYKEIVASGQKTGHTLIQYLETKKPLSKEQQDTLRGLDNENS